MAKKAAIDLAMQSIDKSFKSLEREVKGYKHILDISPRTLNRFLGGDTAKARALGIELKNAIGHSYIGAEDNFIAVSSTQKLNTANTIIAKYAPDLSSSNLEGTRTKARQKFFIEKNRKAGNRLKGEVDNYIEDISRYTSPSLLSELKINVNNKRESLTVSMAGSTDRKYKKLNTMATEAMQTAILKGDPEEINIYAQTKLQMLGEVFKKGSSKVRNIKQKKRIKGATPASRHSFFSLPQVPETEKATDTHSMQRMLDLNLVPTLKAFHMEDKGADLDKSYLRNVTGRFAESAKVLAVQANGPNDVNITYDYMQNVYSVFPVLERGDGPGRDPEVIIGRAIRQVMQEHFIRTRVSHVFLS